MITLTRLNGETFQLNALYIEQIQSCPDATITTTTGKKLVVREEEQIIVARMKRFYQDIGLTGQWKGAGDQE
ncbi:MULTISPECIES: flagellar FlbD family protein [Thalassobacillus]|uniref:flagellar FlbD family protein n=1 Tax=Thalassobacillus TaxID=331971 RepID=UPI000A1CB180|nr:flagellar FlbD family protein [Thalassobacillus devorans]